MSVLLRWPPILRAGLALLVGIVATLALLRSVPWTLPDWTLAACVGVISALIGRGLGLEGWWSAMLVLLPPLFVHMLALDLGAAWYLALFGMLLLVYGSTFSTRVPLYLSGRKVRAALLALLPDPIPVPDDQRLRFIDLGCGFGGVVLSLARARPDGDFLGVELAPLPALIGWCRGRLSGFPNARLRRESLWNVDIRDADVVYVFLSPVPMPALWDKARREMKEGALLVSNSFVIPGVPADRVIEIDDARGSRLHVWRIKARA